MLDQSRIDISHLRVARADYKDVCFKARCTIKRSFWELQERFVFRVDVQTFKSGTEYPDPPGDPVAVVDDGQ